MSYGIKYEPSAISYALLKRTQTWTGKTVTGNISVQNTFTQACVPILIQNSGNTGNTYGIGKKSALNVNLTSTYTKIYEGYFNPRPMEVTGRDPITGFVHFINPDLPIISLNYFTSDTEIYISKEYVSYRYAGVGGGGSPTNGVVTLITPSGTHKLEVAADQTILDAAEEYGLDLPYSCRAGTCSSCVGRIVDGLVDQNDGSYLDDVNMALGYVSLCVAFPASPELTIMTHKEEELLE